MEDTLTYILTKLVDHPDDLAVETQEDGDHVTLLVKAHEEDMGKIIGKNGRIIRAIRDLIKILAIKDNIYADVVLEE